MSNELFEKAVKGKWRYKSATGKVFNTEDLFDIPLTSQNSHSLDDVAKVINSAIKETAEESFVVTVTKANAELTEKLELVKHIIKFRKDENESKLQAKKDVADKNEMKKLLLQAKARKQVEEVDSLSTEQIEAKLALLD